MYLMNNTFSRKTSVAGLEGGPEGLRRALFVRNLPSNVSKIQDLRPQIPEFVCYF
jgi:hypothetical protein